MTDDSAPARELLAKRARQLARPLEDDQGIARDRAGMFSLLIVRLGDERVGLALDRITEVHRVSALTPIPGARLPVVGVAAWRGRVLTVLDIAPSRSGPIAITDSTRILVVGRQRAAFGVVADDVEDVLDVNMHDVAPVDDVPAARRDFIRGVTADALVVVDADALIDRFAPTH